LSQCVCVCMYASLLRMCSTLICKCLYDHVHSDVSDVSWCMQFKAVCVCVCVCVYVCVWCVCVYGVFVYVCVCVCVCEVLTQTWSCWSAFAKDHGSLLHNRRLS